ncbi:uncharacterized protein [Periplaneta americana]|uniref:uncharacterized protein isoform X2 n=1 Tax=Periplaneta americana TaxID=6978 RepID=UPI0037E72336
MALQQTLLAALLVLSVTTAENAETSQVAYIQDKTDVRNNLTESHGHTVASSRTIHGAQDSLTDNTTTVPKSAQARSFSISSIFEGSKGEEEKETPPADGEALPLNKHPLWRVHKYQGIDIRPVPLPTAQYGPPPPQPVESYGPPPVPSPEAPGDTSAALSALDNLSGLANLLPQEGSSGGSLLSVLGSLSSPPQKKGLSPEQLSALASLANLIKQKSPREPASEYGPPSPGVDLSTLASLASLLPQQGDSSLLSTVQSILSKKPAFISSLINTLKLFSPSNSEESEGTAPEAEPNLLELPELPPISIPPNFKFQETGVKQPYVIKYSSSAAPTEYGPPEPSLPYPPASPPPYPPPSSPPYPPPSLQPYPPPVYGPPQVAPYPPSVPSTYGPPPISTYGVPQEPAAFYLPKVSPQQHSPSIAFPNSQPENSPINSQNPPPEPRFPVNSYGQPTLSYNIADSQPSSEFRSDSHEHFIDSNAGHSATDVSLKTDLVPQQSQESVNALRYSLERGASYSDSSNHVQGGPYFGNSRSDTTLPSEPFSNESDFKPSTLAAATGSGYSRVVFQRAQQMVKEEATQGREPDHSAPRSTSNLQNNEQSRSATAASSEDSEEARLHSETGDFHSGYR